MARLAKPVSLMTEAEMLAEVDRRLGRGRPTVVVVDEFGEEFTCFEPSPDEAACGLTAADIAHRGIA